MELSDGTAIVGEDAVVILKTGTVSQVEASSSRRGRRIPRASGPPSALVVFFGAGAHLNISFLDDAAPGRPGLRYMAMRTFCNVLHKGQEVTEVILGFQI